MKKRALSLILALVLVVGLLPMTAFADTTVTEIGTAEQLKTAVTGAYSTVGVKGTIIKLTDNIDLEGAEFDPAYVFYANFDGQGHTISNFTISAPLFGNIAGKTGAGVKNLTVKDVTLKNTQGNQPRLGIVCRNLSGTMENVHVVNCTITSETEALGAVGGLAAMTQGGCSASNCSVSGLTVDAAKGAMSVGGAFGLLFGECSVSNITTSDITVKGNALNIKDDTNTDNYPWGTEIGGLWGIDYGVATVTNCYGTEPDISDFHPVAVIGNVYYDTLQDAFDAATDGDTVKVLEDITATTENASYGKKNNIFAAIIGKKITLDLNEKTIKWSLTDDEKVDDDVDYFTFYLRDGADVTVNGNGTVNELDGGEYHAFALGTSSEDPKPNKLTIENGTFYGCSVIILWKNGGNVCINGGKYVSCVNGPAHHESTYCYDVYEGRQVLNISGAKQDENTKITMYGGTVVGADPRNLEDGNVVADGYTVIQNGNEYTVVPEFSNAFVAILDDVPFVDVFATHYFYDAVKWAYQNEITGGTDAWHFSPDDGCTRAQIVTFLWRAAGCPSATYLGNFTDVDADAYYATAVAWAVENGITNGTSATTFSPEAVCTRADAVTFLYRAFGRNPNYTANFSDVPAGAYYADAVAWAAENGITGGTGGGKFSPADTCSRAQIVTFLYRTLG